MTVAEYSPQQLGENSLDRSEEKEEEGKVDLEPLEEEEEEEGTGDEKGIYHTIQSRDYCDTLSCFRK